MLEGPASGGSGLRALSLDGSTSPVAHLFPTGSGDITADLICGDASVADWTEVVPLPPDCMNVDPMTLMSM